MALPEVVEFARLVGADAVEGGGLVEVVVRVVGEQQGDRRVDAAGAVLGAGERTQRLPHDVDAVLLPGDAVLRGADLLAQLVGALVGLVVGLGGPLGLLVQPVHLGPGVVVRRGGGRLDGDGAEGGGRGGQHAEGGGRAPVEPGRYKAAMGHHGKPHSLRRRTGPSLGSRGRPGGAHSRRVREARQTVAARPCPGQRPPRPHSVTSRLGPRSRRGEGSARGAGIRPFGRRCVLILKKQSRSSHGVTISSVQAGAGVSRSGHRTGTAMVLIDS